MPLKTNSVTISRTDQYGNVITETAPQSLRNSLGSGYTAPSQAIAKLHKKDDFWAKVQSPESPEGLEMRKKMESLGVESGE